tara:strand:- start:1808 stop:2293 length:486 start_codon:yes stop_codon:yes gene_type:complete
MPNWCQNEVTVQANDRGKAEAFVEFVREGNSYFSFNKIVPMPKELKGTRSPTDIVTQEEYDSWVDDTNLGVGKPITQEMSDRFKKEYGYDNWYDWTNANWGTKWDTDCPEVHIGDFGEVRYSFDTAWSPPEPIYKHLTKLFPKLNISWFYKEEDNQLAGWL